MGSTYMWLAGSTLSGSQLGSVWREEAHCQEQVLRIKERGVLHKDVHACVQ